MQILEAYCEEFDEVLDIYGAKEAYFSLPMSRRKRFIFRCSDARCRSKQNPRVSGVNYDKLVEESEKYVQAHFKSIAQQPHTDECVWSQNEVSRKHDVEVQGGTRISRKKATDVIDVFTPRLSDTALLMPRNHNKPEVLKNQDDEPDADDRGQVGGLGESTTSRLEVFVDCWSQLDTNDRKNNTIKLGDQKITYYQAVLNPKHISPSENGERIVQGLVRPSWWPKDNPIKLYLNFADGCEEFREINFARHLTIEIPLGRINKYRGAALLLDKLAKVKDPHFYLKAYAWGELIPSLRGGYLLDLKALDNLTLKVIAKKPKMK